MHSITNLNNLALAVIKTVWQTKIKGSCPSKVYHRPLHHSRRSKYTETMPSDQLSNYFWKAHNEAQILQCWTETQPEIHSEVILIFIGDREAKQSFSKHFDFCNCNTISTKELISSAYKEKSAQCITSLLEHKPTYSGILWKKTAWSPHVEHLLFKTPYFWNLGVAV